MHDRIAAAAQGDAPPARPFLVSNAMTLSGRQLLGLGLCAVVFVLAAPAAWERLEPLERGDDYRIPYALSSDYWLFERMAREAAARRETVVLGDSVVWGQYVTRGQTLSHYLNAPAGLEHAAGAERVANLGVDGMHPAALAGVLEHHAASIAGMKVIVHCNPLWMSSPTHDLSGEGEFRFNHPALVPQFAPRIPCYREEVSHRLGAVAARYVPFLQWASHVQLAYVDQTSVPEWTMEHPYALPLDALSARLPPSDNRLRHRPVPWTEQGIRPQDFAWVELDASFQWRSFTRALALLAQRNNRVFVIVGPFNEHLLTESGMRGYVRVRDGIAAWLRCHHIDHDVPPALPSEQYADASHPLADGYRALAERILARVPWR